MAAMTGNIQVTGTRSAQEVLAWSRELVEPGLREAVDTLPPKIQRVTGYHFGWWGPDGRPTRGDSGGKAIRPALSLLAAEAIGGDVQAALPAAVAVELVHNFSLIQDDVMDGDLTRRHRPTTWRVFGKSAAIVAGDALLTLGLDVVSSYQHRRSRHATRILSTAVLDLMEGQTADVAFEHRNDVELPECVSMAEGKTGSLLGGACALGAVFGGGTVDQIARLRDFGERLGVAFQLADDLLGIWGDPAVTGKPVYSDLHRRKKSLPLVAALTSGTEAGDELARIYYRDHPFSEEELAHAADLVERAGGREWCQSRAEDLLIGALQQLHSAVGDHPAAAELATLARLAVERAS